MRFGLYLSILFCLALAQCTKDKKKNKPMTGGKLISVDLRNSKPINFSEIFNRVEYVRLETDKNHFLGDVKRIRKCGNFFYVQCNNGIFSFDEQGKFKAAIGSKGKGFGKFKVLNDFNVDTTNNRIELMDRRGQKMLYYTLNGLFIDEWKFGINADTFTKLDDHTYLFYTSNMINIEEGDKSGYKLMVVDRSTSAIQSRQLRIDDHKANFILYSDITNFLRNQDSLVFIQSGVDTIYNIVHSKISPRHIFDFAGSNIPDEFYEKDYKDVSYFDRAIEKTEFAGLFNTFLFENNQCVLTFVKKGKKRYLVAHLKNNNRNIVSSELIDDLYFKGNKEVVDWSAVPRGQNENNLYYVVESSSIINKIESTKKSLSEREWRNFILKNKELMKIVEGMTVTDNPIIRICTLKSF